MRIILFLVVMIFVSCDYKSQIVSNDSKVFNIEKYFIAEADSLNKIHAGIRKTIFKNNISEELISKQVDWKSELQPFLHLKFNKPAIINSFFTDTIYFGKAKCLNYTSKDKATEIKQLSIYLNDQKVDSVIVIKQTANLYYSLADTLRYFGKGKYFIKTKNNPRIGKEVEFSLKGEVAYN